MKLSELNKMSTREKSLFFQKTKGLIIVGPREYRAPVFHKVAEELGGHPNQKVLQIKPNKHAFVKFGGKSTDRMRVNKLPLGKLFRLYTMRAFDVILMEEVSTLPAELTGVLHASKKDNLTIASIQADSEINGRESLIKAYEFNGYTPEEALKATEEMLEAYEFIEVEVLLSEENQALFAKGEGEEKQRK